VRHVKVTLTSELYLLLLECIDRYQNESKRLYSVLEKQLQKHDYLIGNKYSVADMSTFTWIRWSGRAGIPLHKFPKLQKWMETIEERPAVQKGLLVPDSEDQIMRLRNDPSTEDNFQGWVMKGENEVKDQHGK
jgi:glutathione S-transferase